MNLKSLIARLNHRSRAAMEAAAGLCLARTHDNIQIQHSPLITKLLVTACVIGSLNYNATQIRSGFVRLALRETLRHEFHDIVAGSPEGTTLAVLLTDLAATRAVRT